MLRFIKSCLQSRQQQIVICPTLWALPRTKCAALSSRDVRQIVIGGVAFFNKKSSQCSKRLYFKSNFVYWLCLPVYYVYPVWACPSSKRSALRLGRPSTGQITNARSTIRCFLNRNLKSECAPVKVYITEVQLYFDRSVYLLKRLRVLWMSCVSEKVSVTNAFLRWFWIKLIT